MPDGREKILRRWGPQDPKIRNRISCIIGGLILPFISENGGISGFLKLQGIFSRPSGTFRRSYYTENHRLDPFFHLNFPELPLPLWKYFSYNFFSKTVGIGTFEIIYVQMNGVFLILYFREKSRPQAQNWAHPAGYLKRRYSANFK